MNYTFTANKGPIVRVGVDGAPMEAADMKRSDSRVFEEGTVDDDLLNEGNRRVRDYYQTLGYFDVKVDHTRTEACSPGEVAINYTATTGDAAATWRA